MAYVEDMITIVLGDDHSYECADEIIGRSGEGNLTKLLVQFSGSLANHSVYLDFEKPNKEKYRTEKLEVTDILGDGSALQVEYSVDPYLLTEDGELQVQVVMISTSGTVWKSSIRKYIVEHSINAVGLIPEGEGYWASALHIDEDATLTEEKGLLIGQKGSSGVEVITLGEGLKLNGGKLELSLTEAEGVSF